MSKHNITAIVLAGGLGVRMKSQRPKVLHVAAGRSLIEHVIHGLTGAGIPQIRIVVGYGAEQVKQHLWGKSGVEFFLQEKQLGTADAVRSAQILTLRGTVLICNGDHPLITSQYYRWALDEFTSQNLDLMVVSSEVVNPAGFGRIVRNAQGALAGIIEEKEAKDNQKKIAEVNSGLYVMKAETLQEFLPQIGNDNVKREFYLTDIVELARKAGKKTGACRAPSSAVCRGVNTQVELAEAGRILYRRKARELMEAGVVVTDPYNTYIDVTVKVQAETVVGPGAVLSAGTEIGYGCVLEPYCCIRASRIGNRVEVRWGTLIDQSEIGDLAVLGPYARIRPESVVEKEAHVGNFVELKKTRLGARAKANHLTYLGDAEIGEDTNIGCGTITCNYAVDRKKYKTKIGKNAFIGSDTQLVAPVTVGDGAVIASGSTITQDVPARALAVARSRQVVKQNYNKEQ